jgi:two-component system, OmpR family, sensor histidine kinase QseC
MTLLRPKSLQKRLLIMILSVVSLVWIISVVTTLSDARHELDEVLDGHLSQVAALLLYQQTHNDGDDDDTLEAPSIHKYAPKLAFQIFQRGELQTQSAGIGKKAMSPVANGFDTVTLGDGQNWRIFAMKDAEKGIQVYVGELTQSRFYVLKAVLNGMLLPFLIALPLLALLIWWVVQRGFAPLRALSENLLLRNPQALHAIHLGKQTPSEMQPMVNALNGLFGRIDAMLISERRFTADAAHELRTPIAAIRAQAQVAIGAGTHDVERNHALQATLKGCDRATRLVDQLLTLARLESYSADVELPLSMSDISAICRREIAEIAPHALMQHQIIELVAAPTSMIRGDDVLLGVLVRNLIDNALRYSKVGSYVSVQININATTTSLMVEDSGLGMTESEIARLGERFFRVLGHDQPGSGLGWSIIQRICKVTDASLDVGKSSQLGGLSVKVSWVNK